MLVSCCYDLLRILTAQIWQASLGCCHTLHFSALALGFVCGLAFLLDAVDFSRLSCEGSSLLPLTASECAHTVAMCLHSHGRCYFIQNSLYLSHVFPFGHQSAMWEGKKQALWQCMKESWVLSEELDTRPSSTKFLGGPKCGIPLPWGLMCPSVTQRGGPELSCIICFSSWSCFSCIASW